MNSGDVPFDAAEIALVVERALGKPASLEGLEITRLGEVANASATGGLWRVRSARGAWSVVVKILRHSEAGHRHWLSSSDVRDPMYWKREARVLASGVLAGAPGVTPPRCFGVFDGEGETSRRWMEDVSGEAAVGWEESRYFLAARHLGELQGYYLARGAPPDEPWLSRQWLRAYVERRKDMFAIIDVKEAWSSSLVKLAFEGDRSESIRQLWDARHRTLDLLEALPQTLCHHDYWSKNLFSRPSPGGTETVAIDWAYSGLGAPGEDLATLTVDTLWDFFLRASKHVLTLEQGVFASYVEGLRSQAPVDATLIRFAYAAATSLKYLWGCADLLFLAVDKDARERVSRRFDIGIEEFFVERGILQRHLLDLGEEARRSARSRSPLRGR